MPSSQSAEALSTEPPPKPKKLEQRLAEAVRARGFSLETEKAYWMWTRQFILHFDMRHPQEMGDAEVQEFLTHLAVDRELRGSSQSHTPSHPDASPRSDRFRCGGRESNFLAACRT